MSQYSTMNIPYERSNTLGYRLYCRAARQDTNFKNPSEIKHNALDDSRGLSLVFLLNPGGGGAAVHVKDAQFPL